jgi:N-methylhydantoinase B
VARFADLASRAGLDAHFDLAGRLQDYAGRLARASLRALPTGRHAFEDRLDGDGLGTRDIVIRAAIEARDGHVSVDFEGTSPQVKGNLNCPLPVTAAAVFYVFRCLMPAHLPPCDGAMRTIGITAPEGSVVNARPPAAVAAGNVETSTRIVDVLTGALARALPGRVPAASQGTMNNLAFGRRGEGGWDYYETLAGGCGAGPDCNGRSARHTHMTNTLNTPVEVLEQHYPMRVEAYALRRGSGGAGRWRGGDGVMRRYRFLDDARVTLLTERRRHPPWGLEGGEPGRPGENRLDGEALDGKCSLDVRRGQVLEIRTPGGGGYGEEPGDEA